MSSKSKGTQREHKSMRRLEALGYTCTRAAASLGEWDVVAFRREDVRLLQVKSNRWPGSAEMEALTMFAAPESVRREVWRWDDHARQPRVRELVPGQGWKERVGV